MSRRLLVVWWTMTGGTRQLVDAFCEGAVTQEGIVLSVRRADEAQPGELVAADAALFATPENLGAMAGMMKDFFDRSYYAAIERIDGRPYASLICAGSDGSGAARQIERIATGWRLQPAAAPLIVCTRAQSPEAIAAPKHIAEGDLQRCRELGAAVAAGLALGVF